MDLFDLSGKRALVTGGARGLGQGMQDALHEAGAQTAVIDILAAATESAPSLARFHAASSIAIRADLSDRSQLKTAFNQAVDALGGLDILVVSHGITHRSPAESFAVEEWDAVIEVNLTSMFLLNQLAGRLMLDQGAGKIINVASLLSFSGGVTVPAYAASKGGVARLTMALSNEWAGRGVNVNAIAPGYMDTQLTADLINDPERNQTILARIPAGRWGQPQDLKGAVIFLASAASDYVNGTILPVDGGWMGR